MMLDVDMDNSHEAGVESAGFSHREESRGIPLRIRVFGFEECSLADDGWVQSSGKLLFWVPPENRHGLQFPHVLTLPTSSPFRATKLDFTKFQCGPSWTNVRRDASY